MPSQKLCSVTRMRRRASSLTCPQGKVAAQSPWKPSTKAPTSTLTMSPSLSFRGPGMPWMTTSLTEMQADPVNPP